MKSYYVELTVIQQVVTELLKLIGVTSFNDLLMRRSFCSWKRGLFKNLLRSEWMIRNEKYVTYIVRYHDYLHF